MGNFLIAQQHGEKALELYDPEAHWPIANLINNDPKTLVHLYNAASAWMLGYPDTAVQEMEAMEAHARRRNHPFDRLVALTFGALPWHYRGDLGEFRGRLDAAREIAREQGLTFFGDVYAPWLGCFALGQEGRHQEAVEALSTGVRTWTELGLLGLLPYAKRLLAESLAATGALDQAIEVLDASLEQIARPGWDERVHLAEVLRVKGTVGRCREEPSERHRGGARAGREVMGATRFNIIGPATCRAWGGPSCARFARANLRLVHRRIRNERSQGCSAPTRDAELIRHPHFAISSVVAIDVGRIQLPNAPLRALWTTPNGVLVGSALPSAVRVGE